MSSLFGKLHTRVLTTVHAAAITKRWGSALQIDTVVSGSASDGLYRPYLHEPPEVLSAMRTVAGVLLILTPIN